MGAAWLSIKIATINACISVVLGTLAGLVLARFGRFRGRTLLAAMTTAPLVMPEVITGLAMLLLFVAMEQLIGWPAGRGVTTITIAHVTFSMAYVTVIVQSRLANFDDSLEEAAMDLGARPAKVFWRITLPLIMPAIISGWLLAFTLSWDDVVISQFVAGPSSTTLPMVIFSKVRLGVSPDVNALATLMVLIVATGVVLSALVMQRQEKRRQREMQLANQYWSGAGSGGRASSRTWAPRCSRSCRAGLLRPARSISARAFPDYPIDPRLAELVQQAMAAGHNQYAPMPGVPALLEQIALKLPRVYGVQVDPVREITVTLGATEAMYSAIQALVGRGRRSHGVRSGLRLL